MFQECSMHIYRATPTKRTSLQTNKPKGDGNVQLSPQIDTEGPSHWPLKAASISSWKQAIIGRLKQPSIGHWRQVVLAAESKPESKPALAAESKPALATESKPALAIESSQKASQHFSRSAALLH